MLDFRTPVARPLIAPSILSADFARMGDECRQVIDAGADLLHLDVMDGHFVQNLTMGPDMCRALRRALPRAFLDVHLMVADPAKFVGPFIDAGANHVTFHVEVLSPAALAALAAKVRGLGVTVGLAVNPPTPVDLAFPLVADFDLFLVMSVNPGFGGQAFIPSVLHKAESLRSRVSPSQRLEVDGGIGPATAPGAISAGCEVLVAGTAVFGKPADLRRVAMEELRIVR